MASTPGHLLKVSLYNMAHKHFLSSNGEGHVCCNSFHQSSDTDWELTAEADGTHTIKCVISGNCLSVNQVGHVTGRGMRHEEESKFFIHYIEDDTITISPYHHHDKYLGISILGGVELLENEAKDRCHFRLYKARSIE